MLDLTVKQFVDHYVPSTAKIALIKGIDRVFEGTIDEFYYSQNRSLLFNNIVSMVTKYEDYLCIRCR